MLAWISSCTRLWRLAGTSQPRPEQWAVSSEKWAVSSEQWAVSSEQWAVRSEQWAGHQQLCSSLKAKQMSNWAAQTFIERGGRGVGFNCKMRRRRVHLNADLSFNRTALNNCCWLGNIFSDFESRLPVGSDCEQLPCKPCTSARWPRLSLSKSHSRWCASCCSLTQGCQPEWEHCGVVKSTLLTSIVYSSSS